MCGCVLALTILLGLAVVAAPSSQAQTFTTFDAPGAGTGANQGTVPISIDTAGDVTGIYWDASNLAHGFVRAANGTITDFDAPGAGTGKNQGTFPFSINTAGAIAGMYSDASNWYHGFVLPANGTITTIDVPGAIADWHAGTTPMSVNAAGDVTGFYRDTGLVYHGFVRAANGTTTFPIDAPGAGAGTYEGTEPLSINAAGDIAGFYTDATFTHHGFVLPANGTITTFDAPGAGTGTGTFKGALGTAPISINTAGDIAGTYTDASGARHGFVRAANGTITTFDAPGAGTGTGMLQGTVGFSINDAGDIAGGYLDASAVLYGFMRVANGTIITFSAPGAGAGPGLLQGTGGFSINGAGNITGAYTDASGVAHGFVVTLAPVILSPTSLFFGIQLMATSSAQSTITLTNNSGSPLTIKSIAVAGANSSDFAVNHNCPISPNTVAAGSGCTLQATFTPQAAGPRKSSVSISDNAGSGVQTIILTGVGTTISTAPSSLTFSSQQVGTPSSSLPVVITNEGSTAVNLWQIAFVGANAGDFSRSNTSTCGNSLGAGANCTVNIIFTPEAAGSRTASLMISDDGGGSPQAVPVAGTGTSGAAARLSISTLVFGEQAVGTTSSAQRVVLTNKGSAPLAIGSMTVAVTTSRDFVLTNTCGSSLAAGASCTIEIRFTPHAAGTRTAVINVLRSGNLQLKLQGTGSGREPRPISGDRLEEE